MMDEFDYLKQKRVNFILSDFLKLLVPYTLLSIVMIGATLWGVHLEIVAFSNPFLLLVLISAITLPHTFVMELFYRSK